MKTHPNTVTDEMLADILSTAYYGGITYWAPSAWLAPNESRPTVEEKEKAGLDMADTVFASDYVALGRTVAILVSEQSWEDGFTPEIVTKGLPEWIEAAENVEGVWLSLSPADLKRGIRKAAEHRGFTVARWFDEHDATEADIAVQFALFGKIIFG